MKVSTTLALCLFTLCLDVHDAIAQTPGVENQPATEVSGPVDSQVDIPGGGPERIYLRTPTTEPPDRPLLLIFHGAYFDQRWDTPKSSLKDQLENLLAEAARRGWYAVSMNGGEAKLVGTYAGPELHRRATAVISQMQAQYKIDRQRIYTLGYSMGGVDAVNYAARHLDPRGPMIAAVWCWSGALSAEVSKPGCNLVPCNRLGRIAASVVQPVCRGDEPAAADFIVNESLGWNLEHLWLTTAQATDDIDHVTCPSRALQSLTRQWKDPSRHTHLADYGKTHNDASAWNPVQICDFFEGKSVQLPTFATLTVAVEDARYFYFDVTRANKEATGVFGWRFAANRLSLTSIENISRLELQVDDGEAPLSSRADLTIDVLSKDTRGTDLILHRLSHGPPLSVTLNGVTYEKQSPRVWDWNDRSSTLTLFGQPGAAKTTWAVDL